MASSVGLPARVLPSSLPLVGELLATFGGGLLLPVPPRGPPPGAIMPAPPFPLRPWAPWGPGAGCARPGIPPVGVRRRGDCVVS
eukprot:2441487-Pyramimonas_sp.AAC.1